MLKDIWESFLKMPVWVSIWVFGCLVPMNVGSLLFLDEPLAVLIAVLAFAGFLPNFVLLAVDRAFTSRMAIPHIIGWLPLIPLGTYVLLQYSNESSGSYQAYLTVLLVVNSVSLVMDIPDAWRVFKGKGLVY